MFRPAAQAANHAAMVSPSSRAVEVLWRRKLVKGRVSDRVVTVAAWNGTRTAPLGILPAERLAKMLLRELADEAK